MPVSTPLLVGATVVWGLLVVLLVVLRATDRLGMPPYSPVPMFTATDTVRVDIGVPDFDAQSSSEERNEEALLTTAVQDQISDASHKVTLDAPCARATVVVTDPDGQPEPRRCSLYLN